MSRDFTGWATKKIQIARFRHHFKPVLFGASCSPFILSAVILKHLESTNYALTVTTMLRNGLYDDNIVSSLFSEDLLNNIICDYFTTCRSIFKDAGFNLRSWTSNSNVLKELARRANVQDRDPVTKVLGLRWNSETDTISFPDKSNILEGNTPATNAMCWSIRPLSTTRSGF